MKMAGNPAFLREWSFQHLAAALQRLVAQLEKEPSLIEPNQLRQRLEALDRLDAYFPYTSQPAFGAESIEQGLYRRARAICARLEAVNCELYEAIRYEIQRGSRPDTLLRWVHPSLDIEDVGGPANGMGYNYLDELISGVFQFEEPDAGHIPRDSEKVFYQPTPARHLFSLIDLAALTATDVLVDLGSGLGHVPLLVSICSNGHSIGIELDATYVERAQQCAQRLNLNRVSFIQEDARVADLSIGTVFYLYTPFMGSILSAMLNRLRRELLLVESESALIAPVRLSLSKSPGLRQLQRRKHIGSHSSVPAIEIAAIAPSKLEREDAPLGLALERIRKANPLDCVVPVVRPENC